mgnify:CR=1 FL=1
MSNKNFSLSGMPDFSSLEVKRREYVFSIMKNIFEKYGFSPLETPAIEKRETLIGNYGPEGDKLVYQLLKSGDFLAKKDKKKLLSSDYKTISSIISDKALRYDLTIPLARYISKNQRDINFPFKRYQMQKVWRADRPQKGRLREFTQCDADIVGSKSLWLESDLIKIYDEVFRELGLEDIVLKVNNRKILEGLYSSMSANFSFSEFCIFLDKIEKKGKDIFLNFLKDNGTSKKNILMFDSLLNKSICLDNFSSEFSSIIDISNPLIQEGKKEAIDLFSKVKGLKKLNLVFDFSLARGLDYYTGMIFEIKCNKVPIGSIGGGGRYDNLTTLFGNNVGSGVGISFGVERIMICLDELNLFPNGLDCFIDVLFVNLGDEESFLSQFYIDKLRSFGIKCELFPDNLKLKKQMSYANNSGAKYTALVGEEEMKTKKITLKNMSNGTQESLSLKDLINKLK